MKKNSKFLLVSAGLATVLGLSSCAKTYSGAGEYTYRSYSSALGTNWNPFTWETNADDGALSYLSEGLVSLTAKDTKNGIYQWAYDMATSVSDVTRTSTAELVKAGLFADEAEAKDYLDKLDESNPGQLVYRVALRDNLKWQDGTAINADSFVNSMKLQLDPVAKNYRANLYIAGESAIAGGFDYYYQGSASYFDNNDLGVVSSLDDLELINGTYYFKGDTENPVKLAVKAGVSALSGRSLNAYVEAYGDAYFDTETWAKLTAQCDSQGFVTLTKENFDTFVSFIVSETGFGFEESDWVSFIYVFATYPEKSFDEVGIYKVDDLTFDYVMAAPLEESQALISFSSSWLVHEELYNSSITATDPFTTSYGTSIKTSMSYGPYKLTGLQAEKQMVFERNENWHGWTKDETGKIVGSTTDFEVDGAKQKQYQATKVVIDVLDDASAKQQFLKGNLSEYTPTASELSEYTLSDALYQVDTTYTMSLFFNSGLKALQNMDINTGNKNSVVLSNDNFRKAFSLAINRADWVTATAAYKPAYSLMNSLYHYDIWNDPTSSYRSSDPAKQAICDLYGVEYGAGKTYATLDEAYNSINGYNLTQAKALMKTAHDELVASGVYKSGEDIKIRIAYSAGALGNDENTQIIKLNQFLSAAVEGSGFGSVTLEGVGSLSDRYGDVPNGEFAIGYGAWGGAAFYPFRNFQVYCDPDQYGINELGCWDPKKESLTISFTLDGETFTDTMTWQAWSKALVSGGPYANKSNEFKLRVVAIMEKEFLAKYYRIPLATMTSAFLLGYQVSYFTEEYNIMYDFGGFRLMKFNYDDAKWAEYVDKQRGEINYK